MLAALELELDGRASWSRPEGGYFLWLDVGVDTTELLGRAEQAGVTFIRGADFFPPGEGGDRSARLAFSFVSPLEIAEGIGRLAALVPAAATV
jgi:DNA-binding transcriptional MocR family regulator